MARLDPRQVFAVIDNQNGIGELLSRARVGDTPGTKNGIIGFSFRDSAGTLVLPMLTAEGKIMVTSDDVAGLDKQARGSLDAGSLTLATITGAIITLTANKKYSRISCVVSCRQDAYFQLQWNNNGATTVLADMVLGSGMYTFNLPDNILGQITAGATGTQQLLLQGMNFETLATLAGSLSAIETAA